MKTEQEYSAVIGKDGKWWIGWIEEVRGVNSQGRTKRELLENLESALREALEMNREAALADAPVDYQEVSIKV